jgi:tetratricopeptide (TPR) repeat protein
MKTARIRRIDKKKYNNKAIKKIKLEEQFYRNALQSLTQQQSKLAFHSFKIVLVLHPAHSDTWQHLPLFYYHQKKHYSIELILYRALYTNPYHAESHSNLCTALTEQEKYSQAHKAGQKSIILNPSYAKAYNNFGRVSLEIDSSSDNLNQVLLSYRHAILIDPTFDMAYGNLGITCERLYHKEASSYFQKIAILLKPASSDYYHHYGYHFQAFGDLAKAEYYYSIALKILPSKAQTNLNYAMILLRLGQFDMGWLRYDKWWRINDKYSSQRYFNSPLWKGENLSKKTILLYTEQGLGDIVQFSRYVKNFQSLGAHVILEVPPPLNKLCQSIENIYQVIDWGSNPPPHDYHFALLSSPVIFKTTPDTIPHPKAYLFADHDKIMWWNHQLSKLFECEKKPRVGLVWSGNPRHYDHGAHYVDKQRSMNLHQFIPVLSLKNIRYISLQKGDSVDHEIKTLPNGLSLFNPMINCYDFSDTAALINCLDLVISVDTSVAHVSAALGKETWLLSRFNACWRWLDKQNTSPWYASLKLFHQSQPGNWDSVINSVVNDLDDKFHITMK